MSWSSSWSSHKQQYAPPVSRESFFHTGRSFYVEVDGHRHERTDSKSLHDLLTYTQPAPLLTKAGKVAKRQPAPHKDPPGHFYRAQLLHYGLKVMKTKEPAKKQLLAAFVANRTLPVPEKILRLEEALRKEYCQANELAKKTYEEEEELREIDEARKRQQQQKDRDAIMQEFMETDLDNLERSYLLGGYESNAHEISRAQLRDAIATLPEEQLRKILAKLVDEIPALEHAMMTEVGKLKWLENNEAGGSKMAVGANKGKGNQRPQELDTEELTGQFEIVAPYLSEQWPDYNTATMTLKISPSSTSSHLWASFDFGIVTGIIRSSIPPPTTTGTPCAFFWRGRESGEGEMSFGEDNTGSLTYLGNGKIKGKMEWMGGFQFVGRKMDRRNVVWSKSVRGWKSKWRGFNEGSYEKERVGRWGGGWGREVVDEKPSISDTTNGEDSEGDEGTDDFDFDDMAF